MFGATLPLGSEPAADDNHHRDDGDDENGEGPSSEAGPLNVGQ